MTVRTINLDTEYKTAIRFPSWLALMVFSIICLASMVSQSSPGEAAEGRRSEEKWAIAITAISVCISFAAVCCYLCVRSLFIAQVPEVAMVRTLYHIRTLLKPNKLHATTRYTIVLGRLNLMRNRTLSNIMYNSLTFYCSILLFAYKLLNLNSAIDSWHSPCRCGVSACPVL
jgi:hypothetical protein